MGKQALAALILLSWTQTRTDEEKAPNVDPPQQFIKIRYGGRLFKGRNKSPNIMINFPIPPGGKPVIPLGRVNFDDSELDLENFDVCLFEGQPEAERIKHLESLLEKNIANAVEVYELTDTQRKKIRIAGKGDIKRFFDKVEERRREFEKVRKDFNKGIRVLNGLSSWTRSFYNLT